MVNWTRTINELSDEVLSLIIYQLNDPGPFSMTCKRFHEISRDPYVRATYFLSRYGRLQAFYWALSRGKLMNERVLDILQTSGAHFSRYLIQVAIHHYFRTTTHFIKNQWARAIPYQTFTHFMTFANCYGSDLPLSKGEDDGTVFTIWLKERLNQGYGRRIELDVIKGLFQKYNFMIFSPKDPLAMQLPLAFAMEPSLLPLAIANGFHLDSRYRDFIFRKMFEKSTKAGRVNEIVQNVRQMTKLDKRMFLSRTVAAEVCMECRTNETGYSALKLLESSNDLRFSLKDLVNDLLELFLRTRSITHPGTILTLQTLFRDFAPSFRSPSPAPPLGYQSPAPRQVMFITIFCASACTGIYFADQQETLPLSLASHDKITCDILHHKLKNLGLLPVCKQDLLGVLVSPWCEKPGPILTWAQEKMEMSTEELQALVEEAAVLSLKTSCKGKLLKKLYDTYDTVAGKVEKEVLGRYQIDVSSVPDHWVADCSSFQAPLNVGLESRDPPFVISAVQSIVDDEGEGAFVADLVEEEPLEETFTTKDSAIHELGAISQDTLSYHIQLDTENNLRVKRRHWPMRYLWQTEIQLKKTYPCDASTIGQWIFEQYGPRHPVTAIFMTHAIINRTEDILKVYLNHDPPYSRPVPITMNHFYIMAKLGRDPSWLVWQALEYAKFYMTEDDYIDSNGNQVATEVSVYMKMEQTTPELDSRERPLDDGNRKRPRRNTVSAPSYLIPDSDDETIQEDGSFNYKDRSERKGKGKARAESHLQGWIKHLTLLLKQEEKKYKEKKKQTPKDENGKPMTRCSKSEFMKSLAVHLRELRMTEDIFRKGRVDDPDSDSDYYRDDGEFVLRSSRNKRRRLGA